MSGFGPATPILRIFDEAAARAFYVEALGFSVLFEHRFGPDMPLYLALRREGVELHLSEHQGDTAAALRLRIAVRDIDAFHAPSATCRAARPRPRRSLGASAI